MLWKVDICAQSASEEKNTEADTFHQSPPKAAYVQKAELLSYLKAEARNGISLSEQASLSMKSSISATSTVKFLQNYMKCVRRSIGQCSLEAVAELATKGWGSQGDGATFLQQWKVPRHIAHSSFQFIPCTNSNAFALLLTLPQPWYTLETKSIAS